MDMFTKEGYRTYQFKLVYKMDLPLFVMTGNKKFILNLNHYRNAHYRTLSAAKKAYAAEVTERLGNNYPKFECGVYWLHYTLYPRTAAVGDVQNALSIIDKFTADALVENGMFSDDNYKIIKGATYGFGEINKSNPRAELRVCELLDW